MVAQDVLKHVRMQQPTRFRRKVNKSFLFSITDSQSQEHSLSSQ